MDASSSEPAGLRQAAAGRALLLGVLLVAALAIRLTGLSARDLWHDEQITLVDSQSVCCPNNVPPGTTVSSGELRTGRGIVAVARNSASHDQPIYIAMIHAWTRLVRPSERTLRLPSAVLGAATVPLVALLGWQLLGFKQGLVGALLVAVAPLHVYYSQEARTYATAVFLVVLSSVASLAVGKARSRLAWFGYGALAAMVPATHLLAGFALVPQGVWLVTRPSARSRMGYAMASAVLLLALLVPLGLADSVVTAHLESGMNFVHPPPEAQAWARPATLSNLASGFGATGTRMLGIEYFPLQMHGTTAAALALPLALAALAAATRPGSPAGQLFVLGGALLPILLVLALCLGYGHVVPLEDRYSTWSLPFLSLLIADGLCRLRPRLDMLAIGAAIVTWSAFLVVMQAAPQKRLGLRARETRALAACGSGVLLVQDALQASVAAAWSEQPLALSIGRAPAGGQVDWALDQGSVCARTAKGECGGAWPPCREALR